MTLSRRSFLSSMGGMAALLAAGPINALADNNPYAIIGTVITGDGSALRTDQAVLVNNGRIEAILPAAEVVDRNLIRIPNAFILPGIINCHCHRIHSSDERRMRYLRHGVTSIGDTASPLNALPDLLHSLTGKTADVACAGPMLCPPGGYPLPIHSADNGMVVFSPATGREAVRKLAGMGTTMVKIAFEPGLGPKPWPTFDAPTASAICNEARRIGLTIRCHVEDLSGLEPALNAGVHTIEHVPYRWMIDGVRQKTLTNGSVIPRYEKLLERMVREEVILTPTIDVFSRSMWDGPRLYEPVRHFLEIGGRVALGNDHPYRRTDAGMPLREMELLGKAGLTPLQRIIAGTQNSAKACGFKDRGVIAPGMKADILVLDNDPLTDMTTLSRPTLVIKDGVLVD